MTNAMHRTRTASIAVILALVLLVPTVVVTLTVSGRGQSDRVDRLTDRVTVLRDRIVRDEQAVCTVLVTSPDRQQSRQIAALARGMRQAMIAADAAESAGVPRVPPQCVP